MSGAISGFGTLFKTEFTGGSGTYTTISEVKSINGPSMSVETIDVTHMQSPGGYREFISSFKDGGEISFDVNFIPVDLTQGGKQGLIFLYDGKLSKNHRILFPDANASYMQMAGLVTGVTLGAQIDGVLSASYTIKVNGQITWPNLP